MDKASSVETKRARCFDLAAAAFSNSKMSLELYERLAGDIAAANDLPALQEIERKLPEIPSEPPEKPQLITTSGSKIVKIGRWVESRRISVVGAASKLVFDFTAYETEPRFRIELDLDCKASDVRIIVPPNIDVIERLSSSSMSVFKDKHRAAPASSGIVVSGSIAMSKVKVKRKRGR